MTRDYRISSTFYDKESHVFTDPVRIVDDIVDFASEVAIQVNSVTTTPGQLVWPANCEILLLRHIDATDIVWIGATDSITAGGAGTWPLRPEDPPLRVRISQDTTVYAVTANGNVDLHILGMVKR